MKPTITEVEFIPIKPRNGLIGFASLVYAESLFLGSIGVHTRLDGSGYRLTFPTKKLGDRDLNLYHPINARSAEAIEEAIFARVSGLKELSGAAD